jgi:hypothetical protein
MKLKVIIAIIYLAVCIQISNVSAQTKVERWKIFELVLNGPKTGNPFTEVALNAEFWQAGKTISVSGFYDGEGKYKVRFMPQAEGEWTYETRSNIKSLNGKKGKLICTPPSKGNHGPVSVADTFYFAYADGTPHHSFGTTSYAWVHQGDSMAALTLKTLSNGYFNKMRMCIFPKDYIWNKNEPQYYPFEGKPLTEWDYTRFNPAYFRNIEKRIGQLDSLGIEADLIVFHPYDRWGFQKMDSITDDRYIQYIIARFAAYKNVWWSMANEYDLMNFKKTAIWQHYLQLFAENDPYHHLRGVHNARTIYESPLVTHMSIQNQETFRAREWRLKTNKPVVYDECRYEGNTNMTWGDITAQEMTQKFWNGVINGGYVGHGETILTDDLTETAVLWWAKGGNLKGESYKRIKFLKEIIESAPAYLRPVAPYRASGANRLAFNEDYFLLFFPYSEQPIRSSVNLPAGKNYEVEVIDTWNMTINKLPKLYSGRNSLIELPGKPGIALRIILKK